jgi:membrane-associated phospholipid phosphatase
VASFAVVPAFRQLDLQASTWAREQKFSGDLEKAIQLSEAFAHGSGVIAIFLVLLWTDFTNRRRLWNVAGYVSIVAILANIAKYFLPRLRPNSGVTITDIDSTWLPVLTGIGRRSSEFSFPSGHSATGVALAIALTMIYPRGKWLFATLAMMAIWQRVYSGAHYPTDCLAGAGIAFAIACLWRFTPVQIPE